MMIVISILTIIIIKYNCYVICVLTPFSTKLLSDSKNNNTTIISHLNSPYIHLINLLYNKYWQMKIKQRWEGLMGCIIIIWE